MWFNQNAFVLTHYYHVYTNKYSLNTNVIIRSLMWLHISNTRTHRTISNRFNQIEGKRKTNKSKHFHRFKPYDESFTWKHFNWKTSSAKLHAAWIWLVIIYAFLSVVLVLFSVSSYTQMISLNASTHKQIEVLWITSIVLCFALTNLIIKRFRI